MFKVVVKSFKGLGDALPLMNYPTRGILATIVGVTASLVTTETVKSYHEFTRLQEVTKQITIQESTKQMQETTKQMQESTKQLEIQSRRWYQFWK